MASFARDLEHEAIGESQARLLPEPIECSGHDFVILNGQMLVVEEDLDRFGDFAGPRS